MPLLLADKADSEEATKFVWSSERHDDDSRSLARLIRQNGQLRNQPFGFPYPAEFCF